MVSRVGIVVGSFACAVGLQLHSLEGSTDVATGDSVPLNEEGFQRVVGMKSDKEMKSFVYRIMMSEARYVADDGKLNGLVPFYSGTQSYLTHKGAARCDTGETVTEQLCLEAAQRLVPAGTNQGRTSLQAGSYGNVPAGCSLQSGGDWAAHFNTNTEGHNNGAYSLVCNDPQTHSLAELKAELRRVHWTADGLGRTAQLTDDGYQKVFQQQSIGHMRAYLRRFLDSQHLKISEDRAFDEFVRTCTRSTAVQKTLAEILGEVKSATWVEPLSSWRGLSGANAPISEDGYQLVAALRNNDEMQAFIERVLASEARTAQDEAGLKGILPYYSGVEAVQSLGALQAEIGDSSRSSWAGLDVGRTAQLSEEGYAAVAARQSNVQMKEFIRRVASEKGMVVEVGAMNGLVPHHSGKIATQSFDKLVTDLDSLQSPAQSGSDGDASD